MSRLLSVLVLPLVAVACNTNQSGDLAARGTGDLRFRLTEQGDPISALAAACDAEPPTGASLLRRRPYVQQLTDRSAAILWTTASPSALDVRVLTADGRVVANATATVDDSARPPEGAVQWRASFEGLRPDTIYCYELRATDQIVRRMGFRTAPAPLSRAVRFVALGDSGDGSGDQQTVLDQVRQMPFEMLIHMGDLAYNQGSRLQIENYYFRVYADLLEGFAVFPSSGNHEYETEDAAPFREAFALPENGGTKGRERWYSYEWGHVHFVVLDTERISPEQVAWLDADLSANRQPWTIVYGHRPPFSSGRHGSNAAVQRAFLPLLRKHRVPLMLSGHDHHYERTVPIDGTIFVVTGGGGVGTRSTGRSSFTAYSEAVLHFLYVVVIDDALTANAIDATGAVFDTLMLRR